MQMFSFVCYFVVISAANVILFFKKQMFRQTFSSYFYTVLSFKTIPIILVILRKTIIFAHSDA